MDAFSSDWKSTSRSLQTKDQKEKMNAIVFTQKNGCNIYLFSPLFLTKGLVKGLTGFEISHEKSLSVNMGPHMVDPG